MAKDDVTLKFDANTASFVQSVLKAREAMEQTADTARKMGEGVKKAGDESDEAMEQLKDAAKDMAGEFLGVAGGIGSIAGAVKLTLQTVDNFFEDTQERAEKLIDKMNELKSLSATGQQDVSPLVREQLDATYKIGGRLVNHEVETRMFADIHRAVGNKVSVEDQLKASDVAQLGLAAHMDEEAATGLGKDFAQLARERKSGGAFEGYSDDQLQDLALQVSFNKPEGLSDRDLRFVARAKDKQQALNLLFAAAQSDESAKALSSVQQAADLDIDQHKINEIQRINPAKRTDEDIRLLKLSKIPKEQRVQAMLDDPTLAPQADRLPLRNLEEGAKRVPAPQSLAGLVAREQASTDPAVKLMDQKRDADAMAANEKEAEALAALQYQINDEKLKAVNDIRHPYLRNIPGETKLNTVLGHALLSQKNLDRYSSQGADRIQNEINEANGLTPDSPPVAPPQSVGDPRVPIAPPAASPTPAVGNRNSTGGATNGATNAGVSSGIAPTPVGGDQVVNLLQKIAAGIGQLVGTGGGPQHVSLNKTRKETALSNGSAGDQ